MKAAYTKQTKQEDLRAAVQQSTAIPDDGTVLQPHGEQLKRGPDTTEFNPKVVSGISALARTLVAYIIERHEVQHTGLPLSYFAPRTSRTMSPLTIRSIMKGPVALQKLGVPLCRACSLRQYHGPLEDNGKPQNVSQ